MLNSTRKTVPKVQDNDRQVVRPSTPWLLSGQIIQALIVNGFFIMTFFGFAAAKSSTFSSKINARATCSALLSCSFQQQIVKLFLQGRRCGSGPKFSLPVSLGLSTMSETRQMDSLAAEILSFIQHASNEVEGPTHCWLNLTGANKWLREKNGLFLVVSGIFLDHCLLLGRNPFGKVKLLAQRYPLLHVVGLQCHSSVFSAATQVHIIQLVLQEYITFPILLSNRSFSESDSCFIFFKDFASPLICHGINADMEVLYGVLKDFDERMTGNAAPISVLKDCGWMHNEVTESDFFSAMQNLLLFHAVCISADEAGDRLFLSDSNHHRIIIVSSNGRILDSIGSTPGFSDGGFNDAQLLRPASSFYNLAENCLYFVDSDNHAIRRANLGERTVKTLHPLSTSKRKSAGVWSWFMKKLGMHNSVDSDSHDDGSKCLKFPWHLILSEKDHCLAIDRRFDNLWVLDAASWEIKELIKGSTILDTCTPAIQNKLCILKQMPQDWLCEQLSLNHSSGGISHTCFFSSFAMFRDQIIFCNTGGHTVVKFCKKSGTSVNINFSNLGILGLPHWFPSRLEKVCSFSYSGALDDHMQSFSLLPGKVNIKISVQLPEGVKLEEPIQEGCVWRRVRGAAVEVTDFKNTGTSSNMVGVAQEWYDELDNLAFSPCAKEAVEEANSVCEVPADSQGHTIPIHCFINTCPGTAEVVIDAVLYLKLSKSVIKEIGHDNAAAKIADVLQGRHVDGSKKGIPEALRRCNNVEDLVFMRPLHVRLQFDNLQHPKAENTKDIILTESTVHVSFLLSS